MLKELKKDIDKILYGCPYYVDKLTPETRYWVERAYDKHREYAGYSDVSTCSTISHIVGGIAYAVLTAHHYFKTKDAAITAGKEASIEERNEYVDNLLPQLTEKYPQFAEEFKDKLSTATPDNIVDILREAKSSCYTRLNDGNIFVKPDWENFFVDMNNGLASDINNKLYDMILAHVDFPILTQILTTPEALAALCGIALAPVAATYGVSALIKTAAIMETAGLHTTEFIGDKINDGLNKVAGKFK